MKMKASEALMEVLLRWGVKRVYGLPGDSIDTTIDALHTYSKKIEFIQVRHEEVASMAAAYESELTGQIAVCLSIGGPGAIHLLNGMYDAKMNGVPILALVGQVTTDNLNTSYFQEVDTKAVFEDVAVYNKTINSAKTLPEVVDEAIRTAYKESGVAVLTLPDNVPNEIIEVNSINVAGKENLMVHPQLNLDRVKEAIELLKVAKKPLVLSGIGCKDAGEELKTFIEINHIPIIQTVRAKGIVDDAHPNSLGNVGKLGTKPAYEAMKSADLLFMLGTNYPFKPYLPNPGQAKIIQVDTNPSNIGKRHSVDVAMVARAKDFLQEMNKEGEIYHSDKFLKACQDTMTHWKKWMEKERNNTTGEKLVHPAFLMKCIQDIAKDDCIYSIDVGTATSWGARFLNVKSTQSYIISAWLATMGCALPGAIAGCLSYPGRQVISLAGDGALAMVMQDLVTAAKYNLPLVQFVLSNHKLAFIEYEQQSAGQRNYGIDLKEIDFAKVAEACGCDGYRVTSSQQLIELLPKLRDVKKPTLVDVYVTDDAPLPGKIVFDEAKGYSRYVVQTISKDHKIPKLPPLMDAIKRFF